MSVSRSLDALATCGDGTRADEGSPVLDGGLSGAAGPSDLGSVRRRTVHLRALLVGLDLVGAAVPWSLVLVFAGHGLWLARLGLGVAFVVISLLLIGVQDLYLARACAIRAVEVGGLARAAIGCGLVGVVVAGIGGVGPTRLGAATAALATFAAQVVLRGCYGAWLRTKRTNGHYSRRVCVLGLEDEADALVELIGVHPEMGYQVVAVVSATVVSGLADGDSDIVARVRASGASGVVIASSGLASVDLNRVIKQLLASGVHVQLSTGLTRIGHRRVRVSPVSHEPLLYLEPISLAGWQRAAKRCMDVVVGSAMLIASLPVLGLAALAIKLDDGGPLIFRQDRVGRGGRTFQVFKLRTMGIGAENELEPLRFRNERTGPLFKVANDPRITRAGSLLRALGIDELPQLVNVLRGEMSLVGPRPALTSEAEKFDDEHLERSSVKPGITGLWQVEARDNPAFAAYRRLDLFYVDNWSLTMDVAILFGTARMVTAQAAKGLWRRRCSSEIRSVEFRATPADPPAIDVMAVGAVTRTSGSRGHRTPWMRRAGNRTRGHEGMDRVR